MSDLKPFPCGTCPETGFSVPSTSPVQHQRQGRPWRVSAIRRLPWDALIAAADAVACAILMVMVITKSNGDRVDSWTLAPAVYLAIFSVVPNVLLRYTFSRGVEITWWVTALSSTGTTVSNLHSVWLHSTSLRSALVSPLHKTCNLVSLASILLALVPASAPLAQRASRTTTLLATHNPPYPLRISALQALNESSAPTGQVSGTAPVFPTSPPPSLPSSNRTC